LRLEWISNAQTVDDTPVLHVFGVQHPALGLERHGDDQGIPDRKAVQAMEVDRTQDVIVADAEYLQAAEESAGTGSAGFQPASRAGGSMPPARDLRRRGHVARAPIDRRGASRVAGLDQTPSARHRAAPTAGRLESRRSQWPPWHCLGYRAINALL
jgi:hypothetical protein